MAGIVGGAGGAGVVRYFRTGQGGLGEIVESEAGATRLPDGATEITREEYEQERAAREAAREARHEQIRQEEAARKQADLEALRAAGLPDATARRVLGVWE